VTVNLSLSFTGLFLSFFFGLSFSFWIFFLISDFFEFFLDLFYNQKDSKIRNSIDVFFTDIFDIKKPFTKSDLDMILTIYKSLDKNIVY
jgi:hypothetical protein